MRRDPVHRVLDLLAYGVAVGLWWWFGKLAVAYIETARLLG
jgi:hypothetical protein